MHVRLLHVQAYATSVANAITQGGSSAAEAYGAAFAQVRLCQENKVQAKKTHLCL